MNPPALVHMTGQYPVVYPPLNPRPSLLGPAPSSVHFQNGIFQLQPQRPPQWQVQSSWLSPPPISFTPPPPAEHLRPHFPQLNLPMTLQGPRPAVLPVFVYHYTDKSGFENIMRTGLIFASGLWKPTGIVYGNGVYLTALEPGSKTSCLMTNNYGNPSYCSLKKMVAKSEYSFQFQAWDLRDIKPVGGNAGRNIFLYPWSWIDLSSCPCIVYRRSVDDGQEEEVNKVELVWRSPLIIS